MDEGPDPSRFESPPGAGEAHEDAAMPQPPAQPPEGGSDVQRVLGKHGPTLLAIDGVEGIAAGRTPTGDDAITVFLRDAHAAASVPRELDGVPVQTVVTGPIDAQ